MEKKNLLESGVSVELINFEAKKEKIPSVQPPLSRMQYYFARKPLISSRLAIAGALLDGNSARNKTETNRLFGLDPNLKKRAYKNIPALLLQKIKEQNPGNVTILDPFAGSGNILFEALRLGLDVVAVDYNPVAYLLLKGTLEFPLKYGVNTPIDKIHEISPSGFTLTPVEKIPKEKGRNLYGDVEKYAELILQKLKDELSRFYPKYNGKTPRSYMHAWAVECPTCGNTTPLVNNWWLSKKKEKIRLNYKVKEGKLVYAIIENDNIQEGNISKRSATCLFCSSSIDRTHIISDISKKEREIFLSVYFGKKEFALPSEADRKAMDDAKNYLKEKRNELSQFIPIEEIADDARAIPARKYLTYWFRLYNPRQLLILASLAKEIRTIIEKIAIEDREYAAVIGTYLSMILAKHVLYNSRCTIWHSSNKQIGHSLSSRGLSMMWNHAETNPFAGASGSLAINIRDVLKGLNFAINELNSYSLIKTEKPHVETYQNSILSWQTDRKFKFIVTDPPYGDDIPYPELMQFFQVWHSRTVGDLMDIPAIPNTTEELSVNPNRTDKIYEARMLIAIKKLHSLLEDNGTLVLFYAHKKVKWWKYLVEALRNSSFVVTSTVSLMTESETNLLARGKSSVFHSLLMTARKRKEDKKTNIYQIENEIRQKIEERYPDLERIYGKDRTNLLISACGIAIEVITQYSEIISFTKNTVDYALEMGQRYLVEFFAKNNLQIENLDPTTMIYVWLRHSLKEEIDYSDFNQTLKALGIEEKLIGDIIHKEAGKRNKVRLIDFSERGPLEIEGVEPLLEESLIDAVHIALRAYTNSQGGIVDARDGIERSMYGTTDIISTIEALSKIRFTKTNYREGEICSQFIRDWDRLHSVPEPRDLTDWTEKKER